MRRSFARFSAINMQSCSNKAVSRFAKFEDVKYNMPLFTREDN